MKLQNTHNYQQLKVCITAAEKQLAYEMAKSKGMTFQGWLGQLIKKELKEEENGDNK